MARQCSHMDQMKITETSKHVCEECVKIGDSWVHLRLCMICGNVGCCDHRRTSTRPNIFTPSVIR